MPEDPTSTDPSLYKVVFENDRVRVLEEPPPAGAPSGDPPLGPTT